MQCHMIKDMLSINDSETQVSGNHKFPDSVVEIAPSKGLIFNTLKMRVAFFNRVNLVKEELKFLESQSKGKRKARPGVIEDPTYTSISIFMRVLRNQYSENLYLIKEALTKLI